MIRLNRGSCAISPIYFPPWVIQLPWSTYKDKWKLLNITGVHNKAWWRHQMETFFCVTGPLGGDPPVTGGFPSPRACDAELWCFLWSAPEQTVGQTIETHVIWDVIALTMTGGFPSQGVCDAELWCFLWSAPEQTVEQTIETQVIWDVIAHIMTSL